MSAQETVNEEFRAIARDAVKSAQTSGAQEVAARVAKVREVGVQWRDGQIEQVTESTTRGLALSLYVDGRFASVSTSDLRPEAIPPFIADAVAMTRTLSADPLRTLPDPKLYADRPTIDLQFADADYGSLTAQKRRDLAQAIEVAARAGKGADKILSVTTSVSDSRSEMFRVTSNGFEGERIDTSFWLSGSVTVQDTDGRRPEDGDFSGGRFVKDLGDPALVGHASAERALARLGSTKAETKIMTMVLDNRSSGRMVGALLAPLSASSIQQRRSFLEGRAGETIGSDLLHMTDDPLIPKAFGSRHFDGEGISSRTMPVFEDGVLRNFYVDTYYGKKLKMAPTTAGTSNLSWKLGPKTQAQLIADAGGGVLVTGFLGGNSNGTTGDYSLGIQGFMIRNGAIAEPVAEMNISGNQLDLWKRLVGIGNDPYEYSPLRTPTLVFEDVSFAGV
ncbi:MAG: TldD/PmbA family protein [Vicinamibacteria bacterium]